MTLDEVRRELWQQLGEPTDLDPSEDTQYNGGPLLNWVINEGQREIASWRDPQLGWVIRMRNLYDFFFFQMSSKTGTLGTNASSTTQITLPTSIAKDGEDRYNGWILEWNNDRKLIMDFNDTTKVATVHEPFSAVPQSGDEVSLYHNFYYLLPSTHPWVSEHIQVPGKTDSYRSTGNLQEILKISDLERERVLSKAGRTDNFIRSRTDIGDPQSWYRFGNRLVFDEAVDDSRWFEAEYYRLPTEVVEDDDILDLPEMFHYGVVLWGIEWGLRRDRENSEKYSTKRDLVDFMRHKKSQYDMEYERDFDHGIMEVR